MKNKYGISIQLDHPCAYHPSHPARVKCPNCGKAVCLECARWIKSGDSEGYANWCKVCYHARLDNQRRLPATQLVTTVTKITHSSWRFDWVGSLIGTIILTVCTTVGGPVGFVIGVGLWWLVMSLRR